MNDVVARVRRAHLGDIEAVVGLVHAAYARYVARLGNLPGPMLDDYAQRIADGQAWVLEYGGGLAGVLVLEDVPGAVLLDNVAVAPSAQGQGHGRALVAFADAEARRRGRGELKLYTHALMSENQTFYTRLGFRETGRVSEKGYERAYMAKQLL